MLTNDFETMGKKIMIIDGGPRKGMNTAQMLEAFARGVTSLGEDIEVKTVRLYDMMYQGCMSCMACKVKGKASKICKYKDELQPLLEEISNADGLVMGSPIYMGDRTAKTQAMLERLVFPWLSYADGSITAVKKMPAVFIYTMNATEEQASQLIHQQTGMGEQLFQWAFGDVEIIEAYNTYQVKNYDRFEYADGTAEAKQAYKDAHWEQDLQKAFEAGKRMAEKIL